MHLSPLISESEVTLSKIQCESCLAQTIETVNDICLVQGSAKSRPHRVCFVILGIPLLKKNKFNGILLTYYLRNTILTQFKK